MAKWVILLFENRQEKEIIPAEWLINGKEGAIFPSSHSLTQKTKAILAREMPRDDEEWSSCPVSRILGEAGEYSVQLIDLSTPQCRT